MCLELIMYINIFNTHACQTLVVFHKLTFVEELAYNNLVGICDHRYDGAPYAHAPCSLRKQSMVGFVIHP